VIKTGDGINLSKIATCFHASSVSLWSLSGQFFKNAADQRTVLQKFGKFKAALEQHVLSSLPPDLKEDWKVQFDGVLSGIRTFRNDARHPSGKIMEREQVYVLLQMFIPYC
jgi:hypothetical protein